MLPKRHFSLAGAKSNGRGICIEIKVFVAQVFPNAAISKNNDFFCGAQKGLRLNNCGCIAALRSRKR